MGKGKSELTRKLPAIGPMDMTGMMMHTAFQRSAKAKKTFMPFRGLDQKLNDLTPQTRIENGDSVLEVWREYHGLTFEQMANKTGVSLAKYLDYESEDKPVPYATQKRICRSLKIHPIEFYDYNDICDSDYIRLLVDAYNNHTSYKLFGRSMQEDLMEALEHQGDEDESFYTLKNYREQILSEDKKVDPHYAQSGQKFLAGLIDELIINDGNPHFANYILPSEVIENAKQLHYQVLRSYERAMDKIKSYIERHEKDMRGISECLFGSAGGRLIEKWFSYYEEMYDKRDLYALFIDDVHDYGRPEADISDADAFFDGMVEMFEQYKKSMNITLESYELTERIDAIEKFQRDMQVTLAAYDNRQIILAQTDLLEPYGMPNHSNYMQSPQITDYKSSLTPKY